MNLKNIMTAGLLCLSSVFAQCAELSYTGDADAAYSALLNQLKRDGYDIATASKDAGIQTADVISGHVKPSSTHMRVTMLTDEKKFNVVIYSSWRISVRVPWSTPKVEEEKSREVAARLKDELHW